MSVKREASRVHPALEERLLITDSDRKVLKAIDSLSPKMMGDLYIAGNPLDRPIPTPGMIAKKTEMTETEVLSAMEEVRKKWHLPDANDLPTNQGILSNTDALTWTLLNQHRLRWSDDLEDYRVARIHILNGDMGTGTLFANQDAMRGERLVRNAMGISPRVSSIHFTDVMPEVVELYGKAKHQRALTIGVNKPNELDKDYQKVYDQRLQEVDFLLKKLGRELTPKDYDRLKEFVLFKIQSRQEAALVVAEELAPLIQDVAREAEVHFHYGYGDDANLNEMEKLEIAAIRRLRSKGTQEAAKIDSLERKIEKEKARYSKATLEEETGKAALKYITEREIENPREVREALRGYFYTPEGILRPKAVKLRDQLKKRIFGGSEEAKQEAKEKGFDDEFEEIAGDYGIEITTPLQVERKATAGHKKATKSKETMDAMSSEIAKAKDWMGALAYEQGGVPTWFNSEIAITGQHAAAMSFYLKEVWRQVYTDTLFPALQRNVNRDLKLRLHTDRFDTFAVPEPGILITQDSIEEGTDFPLAESTVISWHPRPDRQKSDEASLDTFTKLHRFQESSVAHAEKIKNSEPKNNTELGKDDFAHSDLYITTYGAEGYLSQPKFRHAPSRIEGEYEKDTPIVQLIKLPTRHDGGKLVDLMRRGNKGTWAAKRFEKGGKTSGNVIRTYHPDQSTEDLFIDDEHYARVWQQYGAVIESTERKIGELQTELKKRKLPIARKNELSRELELAQQSLKTNYEAINPHISHVLLSNDLHVGAYTWPGRESNVNIIPASSLAALQSMGMSTMKYGILTEGLNGDAAWKAHDSTREGRDVDPLSFEDNVKLLTKQLIKNGASEREVAEAQTYLRQEWNSARPVFMSEHQIEMFKQIVKPMIEDTMESGTKWFFGGGNHWNGANKGKHDEGKTLADLFDSRYQEQGLLYVAPTRGQDYATEEVLLPSENKIRIVAKVAHKGWHGTTEISALASQMTRMKTTATYGFYADRHHPGAFAERGKMGVLDCGKQTVIPYCDPIGKVASVNGTMIAGYGARGELALSSRYFIQPVVETISGWNYKADILNNAHQVIVGARKERSLAIEKAKIDSQIAKLGGKVSW